MFGEIEGPRIDRELEHLESLHEIWANAVPTRGTCLLARRKEPLTSNCRSLCWENVCRESKEIWESLFSPLYKPVRVVTETSG